MKAAASFAAEVALIDLRFPEYLFRFAPLVRIDRLTKFAEVPVDRIAIDAQQDGCFRGSAIRTKSCNDLCDAKGRSSLVFKHVSRLR